MNFRGIHLASSPASLCAATPYADFASSSPDMNSTRQVLLAPAPTNCIPTKPTTCWIIRNDMQSGSIGIHLASTPPSGTPAVNAGVLGLRDEVHRDFRSYYKTPMVVARLVTAGVITRPRFGWSQTPDKITVVLADLSQEPPPQKRPSRKLVMRRARLSLAS